MEGSLLSYVFIFILSGSLRNGHHFNVVLFCKKITEASINVYNSEMFNILKITAICCMYDILRGSADLTFESFQKGYLDSL